MRTNTHSEVQRLLVQVEPREEIVVGAEGVSELVPREGWRPYLKTALDRPLLAERKTGVKHAEVITPRLLQDERGWLRLAG